MQYPDPFTMGLRIDGFRCVGFEWCWGLGTGPWSQQYVTTTGPCTSVSLLDLFLVVVIQEGQGLSPGTYQGSWQRTTSRDLIAILRSGESLASSRLHRRPP